MKSDSSPAEWTDLCSSIAFYWPRNNFKIYEFNSSKLRYTVIILFIKLMFSKASLNVRWMGLILDRKGKNAVNVPKVPIEEIILNNF